MSWFGRSKVAAPELRYGDWLPSRDGDGEFLARCSDGMIVARIGENETRRGEFLADIIVGPFATGPTRSFVSLESARIWAYRAVQVRI